MDRGATSPTEQLETEIMHTWGILFGGLSPKRRRQLYYSKLVESPIIPYKKYEHYGNKRWWQHRTDPEPTHFFSESTMHLGEGFAKGYSAPRDKKMLDLPKQLRKNPMLSYSDFPIYEGRLRILMAYMNSRKPRNLRQLRKDSRDTLNYWTFWVAVIAGSITVFLAFSAVLIAIVQTVAAYRALH
jgi:hypothetical protein